MHGWRLLHVSGSIIMAISECIVLVSKTQMSTTLCGVRALLLADTVD